MTDDMSGTADEAGYDPSMEDAGITQESFNQSPNWAKERFGKLTRQREEARERADAAERRLANLEGKFEGLESRVQQPSQPREEPKGLDRYTKVSELKAVQKRLYEFQALASDPDAEPEARQAARAQLSQIDDVAGTLADINERIADIKVSERLGGFEKQLSEREAAAAGMNSLTQSLFLEYGEDAIRQGSALNKAASGLIQEWIDSGDVTASNARDPFVLKSAYKEAASKIKYNRGGRGSDPRHSAVESGGASRGPANQDAIAALKQRAQAGDYQAGKKARNMELSGFLDGLIARGDIG